MYYAITGWTDKTPLDHEGLKGEDAWDITKRLAGKSTSNTAKTERPKEKEIANTQGDDDPVKWGCQRVQELERERSEADMDYLPEDYFDGMPVRRAGH
jgi:hypothetical protein